jgi:hypothetical protein
MDEPAFRMMLGRSVASLRVQAIDNGGRTSERYRLRWKARGNAIAFAKRYSSRSGASVAREFDALVRLRSALSESSALAAPRPLLALPAHSLIVLEWIDGRPLSRCLFRDMLARTFARAARASRLVERAAEVLLALRAIPVDCRMPGDVVQRYQIDCDRRLAALERLRLGDAIVERIRAALRPALEGIESADLAFQHSDFGPWNLLVDRAGRVWVIDLHNATVGHRAYDEAFFLTALDIMKRYRVLAARRVTHTERAFRGRLGASDTSPRRLTMTGTKPARGVAGVEEVDPTVARFGLAHMAYFAAGINASKNRRERIWMPRPLVPFMRDWFERELARFE